MVTQAVSQCPRVHGADITVSPVAMDARAVMGLERSMF